MSENESYQRHASNDVVDKHCKKVPRESYQEFFKNFWDKRHDFVKSDNLRYICQGYSVCYGGKWEDGKDED